MAANANVSSANATVIFSANVHIDAVRPLSVGDYLTVGALGTAEVLAIDTTGLSVTVNSSAIMNDDLTANSVVAAWKWNEEFDAAPDTSSYASARNGANDEIHIVVVDQGGQFTGVANTILEKYPFASKASDASNDDGSSNYYRDIIKNRSKYIWWMDHLATGTNWGTEATGKTFTAVDSVDISQLSGGVRGAPSNANTNVGWDYFKNGDEVDVSLLITGEVWF
jgi:hypothetical protein